MTLSIYFCCKGKTQIYKTFGRKKICLLLTPLPSLSFRLPLSASLSRQTCLVNPFGLQNYEQEMLLFFHWTNLTFESCLKYWLGTRMMSTVLF